MATCGDGGKENRMQCTKEMKDDATVLMGGELGKIKQCAKETNKGGGKSSSVEPLLGTLLQVRRCRDDSIAEIVRELGSSSNVRWSRELSVPAAMVKEKLWIGHALRNG